MSPRTAEGTAIDPRIRQRREQVERSRTQKRLRWLAVFVGLAILVAAGVFLLHTPWFKAKVVTVTGIHPNTTTQAIEAAAGVTDHPPLISVDPGPAATRVETLPFIASARVVRHWPDAVSIAVTERVPVTAMAGPTTQWSTLDGNGRTLAVTTGRPALPVLAVSATKGSLAPAPVGATIGAAADSGLLVARTLPPAFVAQVSSITEAVDGTVSLGLTSGLVVQLGTVSNLPAKYEDVAALIAHADLHGVHTIDVTVPQSPTVGP
jgi:cell division protein FtsQ